MDEQKIDEIKFKINSKNVTVMTEAVDILIRTIGKIIENGNRSGNLENYLQLLQDICASEDPKISSTACHGLLSLLADGLLNPDKTLSLTTSTVLAVKNYSGITSVISQILVLNVLQEIGKEGKFKSKWQLSAPIHPFVYVLQRHPDAIQNVYNEMVSICSPTSSVYDNCVELLRPVFIWILCNPEDTTPSFYKLETLRLILSLKNTPFHKQLLLECLMIQQISTKYIDAYEMYTVVAEWAIFTSSVDLLTVILPILVTICEELTLHGENPTQCLRLIRKVFDYNETLFLNGKIEKSQFEMIGDYTLGLLARVVIICPVAYMLELILLCNQLCKHVNLEITKGMVICAVLQWEFNKNMLTKIFEKELKILLDNLRSIKTTENNSNESNFKCSLFNSYKMINKRIYLITEQYKLYDLIKGNREKSDLWLSNLKSCKNTDVKHDFFLFLQSILVTNLNSSKIIDTSEVFELTMDIVNSQDHLMIAHLPVILYCLHFTQVPQQTLHFLHGIPQMAAVKENIPVVVDVLKRLESNKTISKSLLINMCLKLVEKQNRCFPYLQTLLIKADNCEIDKKWELLTAKANAIKYICETRASSCGIQVVPILSEILTHSISDECSAACSLTLEAIEELWKAEVIDPISTWQVLGSKFHSEKRSIVIVGICNLLALVPSLYYESSEYDDFIHTTIIKLWRCITDFDDEAVNFAAFDALSKFDLKHMTMRQFPDLYKQGVKLPSSLNKLTDVPQTIDDMTYIPSNVWGNLFKNSKITALSGVNNLCQILINREVSAYHGGMYNVAIEPESLKHLPLASVVKGIIEYVRKEINIESMNPNMAECLKCLSLPFDKPLPPINWIFLASTLKMSDTALRPNKVSIMKLLSKQVEVSQSAVKIISDYLEFIKSEFQISEIEVFSEIMSYIVNCVKPTLFLSTLETSLNISYSMTITDDEKFETSQDESSKDSVLFCNLLKGIKECLSLDTILEATKIELSSLICRFYDTIKFENELWIPYADICCEVIEEDLAELLLRHNKKANYLRSKMALEGDPESCLSFLDEIINVNAAHGGCFNSIMPLVKTVISKLDDKLLMQSWILKTLNDIHKKLSESTNKSVELMCNVFAKSVITVSGIDVYETSDECIMKNLPQAIEYLFSESAGGVLQNLASQIIEWAHANVRNGDLPADFSDALELTLVAHCAGSAIREPQIWPKYAASFSTVLNKNKEHLTV